MTEVRSIGRLCGGTARLGGPVLDRIGARFGIDWELVRGLGVFVASLCALGWALAMCFVEIPIVWRGAFTVAVLIVALFFASAEWKPRTLGLFAVSGLVLVGVITIGIGRADLQAQAAEQAIADLERMASAAAELDQLTAAGPSAVAPPTAAASEATWAAIEVACGLAEANTTAGDCDVTPPAASADAAPSGTGTLPVATATARLRLAEYRQNVLGRPEDAIETQAASAALAGAIGALSGEPPEPASVLDALAAGGDAIAGSLFGDPPILIATVGWVVLAFAALMFWRLTARRSFAELPGPVTISLNAGSLRTASEPEARVADTAQRAAFRVAVLRNVSEPGALPGAAAIQTLTDLAELPGLNNWFAPVVNAVKSILAIPRGFKVSADVVAPEAPGGQWIVLVRVSDLDSGREIAVSTQTGDSDIKACRSAGYWAAAVVLGRSSRIPSWAGWDSPTSTALALYDEPESTPAGYTRALAKAPSSGVLLQKLAAAYDLAGDLLDSVSMSARAVAAHPRYHVARYRLAGGINMLADSPQVWTSASPATRKRLLGQLTRALGAIRVAPGELADIARTTQESGDPAPPASAEKLTTWFHAIARGMFDRYRRDLTLRGIVGRSLRRSERDIWWSWQIFGRGSIRSVSLWTVRSALLICDADSAAKAAADAPGAADAADQRRHDRDLDRVCRRAHRPSSHFQLSYNLACYYARRGVVNVALTWLETSLERANSWQITDGWLDVDPDLAPVRTTARYAWVAGQVRSTPDEGKPHADDLDAVAAGPNGRLGARRDHALAGPGR